MQQHCLASAPEPGHRERDLATLWLNRHRELMDLDSLLLHYFGTADLEELSADRFERGLDQARVALGVERDRGRKFALWAMLHALGEAPDPAAAFKDEASRRAAEEYAWAAGKIEYRR